MIDEPNCRGNFFPPCKQSNYLASSTTRGRISLASGILACLSASATGAVAICFTATAFTAVAITSFALLTITCTVVAYWIATMQPQDMVEETINEIEVLGNHHNSSLSGQDFIQAQLQKKLDSCATLEEFYTNNEMSFNNDSLMHNSRLQELISEFVKREVNLCVFGEEATAPAQACLQFLQSQGLIPEKVKIASFRHQQNQEGLDEEEQAAEETHETTMQEYQTKFNSVLAEVTELLPEVSNDDLMHHMRVIIEHKKKEESGLLLEIKQLQKQGENKSVSVPVAIAESKRSFEKELSSLRRQRQQIAKTENRKVAVNDEMTKLKAKQEELTLLLQGKKLDKIEDAIRESGKEVKGLQSRKSELEKMVNDCSELNELPEKIFDELAEIAACEAELETANEDKSTYIQQQAELEHTKAKIAVLIEEDRKLEQELEKLSQLDSKIAICLTNSKNASAALASILAHSSETTVKIVEMEDRTAVLRKEITALEKCYSESARFNKLCADLDKTLEDSRVKISAKAAEMKQAIMQSLN